MAHDFTAPSSMGSDFHSLRTAIPGFLDIDPNMDPFHLTDQLNPTRTTTLLESSSAILPSALNFQDHHMNFPEFPGSLADTFPSGIMFHTGEQVPGLLQSTVPPMGNKLCESRKRKDPDVSGSSSRVSSHSSPASGSGTRRKTVRPPSQFWEFSRFHVPAKRKFISGLPIIDLFLCFLRC